MNISLILGNENAASNQNKFQAAFVLFLVCVLIPFGNFIKYVKGFHLFFKILVYYVFLKIKTKYERV